MKSENLIFYPAPALSGKVDVYILINKSSGVNEAVSSEFEDLLYDFVEMMNSEKGLQTLYNIELPNYEKDRNLVDSKHTSILEKLVGDHNRIVRFKDVLERRKEEKQDERY